MKQNAKIILLLISLSFFTAGAFAQTCNWIKLGPAGSLNPLNSANNYSLSNGGIAIDKLGNVISVSANWPLCGGGNTRYDYFLSKYDPSGNLLWRHKFKNGTAGADVAVDKVGNIYVVSSYFIDIDNVPITLDPSRNYLLKFSSSGQLLWYKSYGPVIEIMNCYSSNNRYQRSFLKYHEASNSLIFYTSPLFPNPTFPFLDTTINTIPHPAGNTPADLLISRLDTSGGRIWTKIYRNDSTLKAGSRGLDFNNQGQLVISGFFEKYMRFGNITLSGTATWDNLTARHPFVALLNFSDGQLQWAKKMIYTGDVTNGGNYDDYVTPVAISESGRIGLVHAFNDTTINPGNWFMRNYKLVILNDSVIKSISPLISGSPNHTFYGMSHFNNSFYLAGGSDLPIIAKYDTAGNSLFYKKIPNNNNAFLNSIVTDEYKNIYIGGALTYYPPTTTITVGCATLNLTPGFYKFEIPGLYSDRGNIVRGTVFRDINSNSVKDPGEPALPNVLVSSNTGSYAFTNQSGDYNIFLGQGNHVITANINLYYHVNVPPNYTVNFTGVDQLLTGRNFALQPIPNVTELEVDITPLNPRARPGWPAYYQLTYKNKGTTTHSNSYAIKMDPQFIFINSDSIPSFTSPDSLRFNFVNLQPYDIRTNVIRGTISTSAALGSFLKYKAYIYPIVNDTVPQNNIDSISQLVSGGYDPNSKEVFPAHKVLIDSIVAGQQSYEYTLFFQNTGNDTAFHVRILDTIPAKLNMSTFELVSYSHPVSVDYKASQVVEFRFTNIQLPDSNINEPRSHGFVKFRIKPITGLTILDTIYNNCSIYFDYNAPVRTNTTVTTFRAGIVTGVGNLSNRANPLKIYPNPAKGTIHYELPNAPVGNYTLSVYDLDGRLIYQQSIRNTSSSLLKGAFSIETSPGNYIIELKRKNLVARRKILLL